MHLYPLHLRQTLLVLVLLAFGPVQPSLTKCRREPPCNCCTYAIVTPAYSTRESTLIKAPAQRQSSLLFGNFLDLTFVSHPDLFSQLSTIRLLRVGNRLTRRPCLDLCISSNIHLSFLFWIDTVFKAKGMKKTKRDCFSIGTGSLTKWEEGGMLKIAFIFCHMKLNTLFKKEFGMMRSYYPLHHHWRSDRTTAHHAKFCLNRYINFQKYCHITEIFMLGPHHLAK